MTFPQWLSLCGTKTILCNLHLQTSFDPVWATMQKEQHGVKPNSLQDSTLTRNVTIANNKSRVRPYLLCLILCKFGTVVYRGQVDNVKEKAVSGIQNFVFSCPLVSYQKNRLRLLSVGLFNVGPQRVHGVGGRVPKRVQHVPSTLRCGQQVVVGGIQTVIVSSQHQRLHQPARHADLQ